jgi:hypothetical protein
MAPRAWARITDRIADVLRRGAWYPVVEQTSDEVVVDVAGGKRIRLSREDVRVRETPPDRWSVVVRTGVLRPTLGGKGGEVVTTYGVCPHCRERQELTGKPAREKCGRCGAESPVDWSETV